MRAVFALLMMLASCHVPVKAPKSALPGCAPSSRETRSSLEGAARRDLDQDDTHAAVEHLKQAACYEGAPDPLLLDSAARATLVELLKRHSRSKEAAALLLETPGGRDLVLALAKDAPPSAAVALWAALAAQGDETSKAPLLQLAQSPDPAVQAAALRALLQLGALSVTDAEAALSSENPSLRAVGVEIAARYNPALLTKAAEDPDSAVRSAVVYSLTALDTEDAAALASLLLFDDDLGVRLAALEIALQLGIAKEETMTAAMQGNDPLIALSAARAAGSSDPAAVKVLLSALDGEGAARRNAILLTGSFTAQAKEIAPRLHHIIVVGSDDEKVLAAAALLRIEPALPAGKPAREAQDEAMSTLSSLCEGQGRPAVRGCAELAPRGDARAKQRLRVQAVSDPDPVARSTALRALGLFGPEFLNELSFALADPDDEVRFTAAQQILKIVGATRRPHGRQ